MCLGATAHAPSKKQRLVPTPSFSPLTAKETTENESTSGKGKQPEVKKEIKQILYDENNFEEDSSEEATSEEANILQETIPFKTSLNYRKKPSLLM